MKIQGAHYRTIWPHPDGKTVEIIDQTQLPHVFVTVTLSSTKQAAEAIRSMQVRGAPLIGATAAYGIAFAMREAVERAGFWAPLLYLCLQASRGVTWLPGSIVSPLGGILFGFWRGVLLAWIGVVAACLIAFALARWLRSPDRSGPVARRFRRLEETFGGRVWLAVLVARLIPGIPFNATSYAAGATSIAWPPYLAASAAGVLPRMAVQVALGAGVYGVAAAA